MCGIYKRGPATSAVDVYTNSGISGVLNTPCCRTCGLTLRVLLTVLVNRFERATKEAVQTLARRDMPTKDLAAAIRRCLNNLVRTIRRSTKTWYSSSWYSIECSKAMAMIPDKAGLVLPHTLETRNENCSYTAAAVAVCVLIGAASSDNTRRNRSVTAVVPCRPSRRSTVQDHTALFCYFGESPTNH